MSDLGNELGPDTMTTTLRAVLAETIDPRVPAALEELDAIVTALRGAVFTVLLMRRQGETIDGPDLFDGEAYIAEDGADGTP